MSGQDTYDDGDIMLAFEPHSDPVPVHERERRLADPGFGRVFTDHMAVIDYNQAKGWHGGRITARKPFAMDPASPVLHYAQEIFEGLKAYRRPNGGAALFRPDANARRFAKSAIRKEDASHGTSRRRRVARGIAAISLGCEWAVTGFDREAGNRVARTATSSPPAGSIPQPRGARPATTPTPTSGPDSRVCRTTPRR